MNSRCNLDIFTEWNNTAEYTRHEMKACRALKKGYTISNLESGQKNEWRM
jgi:hypothetical protein